MGIDLLSKLPGLVVVSPRRPPNLRQGRSNRSMVDGLILQRCAFVETSSCCSPCCLSTLIISGRNGCNRFEHSRSLASQMALSGGITSRYVAGRPRRLLFLGWHGRFSNLMAALRCKPVTCVNSSNILPFPSFDAPKYRILNACAYSRMPRRVTFTSFGNTNFDPTTPPSVTFIMSQCVQLTT